MDLFCASRDAKQYSLGRYGCPLHMTPPVASGRTPGQTRPLLATICSPVGSLVSRCDAPPPFVFVLLFRQMVVRKNNHTTTRRKFIFDFDSYEVQSVEKSYDIGYAPFKDLKIVRRVPACSSEFFFTHNYAGTCPRSRAWGTRSIN